MSQNKKVAPILVFIWLCGLLFWWGLAFYPTSEQSPNWLIVAREVCFGAYDHGLPDAGGWLVLILGPFSFVVVGTAIWKKDLEDFFSSSFQSHFGKVAWITVLIAISVEATWVYQKVSNAANFERFSLNGAKEENLPENYPQTNIKVDDFSLVDQHQSEVSLSRFKNEVILLTVAFAHCETICPVIVKQALDAQKEIGNLRVLIITLDPWRDTPKALPFLADKWGMNQSAHILSGKVENVERALKNFKIPYQRNEETGDVTHPAIAFILDRSGDIAFTFNNVPTKWLVQAVKKVENSRTVSTTTR